MANAQYRGAMRRRLIAKALDQLLADEEQEVGNLPTCTGAHHRGYRHDWWGSCSGMKKGYEQREYLGRPA